MEKVDTVEEKLDGIDKDDIGNLEDSPRFAFIAEECENLIVVNKQKYFFCNHVEYWESGKHDFFVGQ